MGATQNFDVNNASQNAESAPAAAPPPHSSGGRNIAIIGVVAVVVAGMIWAAVRFSHRVPAASSGPVANVHELEGRAAPAFTLKTLDGATANLADYKGKAVMLDFWATWCGPCRIEMPWFPEIQKKYGPQGFTILAIN